MKLKKINKTREYMIECTLYDEKFTAILSLWAERYKESNNGLASSRKNTRYSKIKQSKKII
jgi:hypothetical protein